ncbi:MAG: hypothetical protein AAF497_15855, partial [Planctomycetota bacterium]
TQVENGVADLSGFFNFYEDRVDSSPNPGGFTEAAFPDEDNFLDGDLMAQFNVTGSLDAGDLAVNGVVPSSVRGVYAENIPTGITLELEGSFNPAATDEDGNLSLWASDPRIGSVGGISLEYDLIGPLDSKEDFGIFGYGGVGTVDFDVTTVPEPSGFAITLMLSLGLLTLRRRS